MQVSVSFKESYEVSQVEVYKPTWQMDCKESGPGLWESVDWHKTETTEELKNNDWTERACCSFILACESISFNKKKKQAQKD